MECSGKCILIRIETRFQNFSTQIALGDGLTHKLSSERQFLSEMNILQGNNLTVGSKTATTKLANRKQKDMIESKIPLSLSLGLNSGLQGGLHLFFRRTDYGYQTLQVISSLVLEYMALKVSLHERKKWFNELQFNI